MNLTLFLFHHTTIAFKIFQRKLSLIKFTQLVSIAKMTKLKQLKWIRLFLAMIFYIEFFKS